MHRVLVRDDLSGSLQRARDRGHPYVRLHAHPVILDEPDIQHLQRAVRQRLHEADWNRTSDGVGAVVVLIEPIVFVHIAFLSSAVRPLIMR